VRTEFPHPTPSSDDRGDERRDVTFGADEPAHRHGSWLRGGDAPLDAVHRHTDSQSAMKYETRQRRSERLPVGTGIETDFVYATAFRENTFVVKAVARAGNTSEPSNTAIGVLALLS
jgi:hypothetical protein